MALYKEQIRGNQFRRAKDSKPGGNRWIKKQLVRAMRRLAKRDPEGAPRRRWFRGWVD